MTKLLIFAFTVSLIAFGACNQSSKKTNATNFADAIYFGGDIITMEGDNPDYAEAVAVKNGKIYFVGSKADAEKMKSDSTVMNDLQGKTMLPGFIDTWGHIGSVASLNGFADLGFWNDDAPKDFNDIIVKLKQSQKQLNKKEGEWIVGMYYDQTYLKENRHPSREDFDKDFPNNPVMLIHLSGLMGVANSAALKQLGISDKSPDPQGGTIVRKQNSKEPDGLLQGRAYFVAMPYLMGKPDMDQLLEKLEKAQVIYSSSGFTTVQDGGALPESMAMFKAAVAAKKLKLDIIAYPSITMADMMLKNKDEYRFGVYDNHLKLRGMGFGSDGGPQERTALFSKPYLTKLPPGKEFGNPLATQEEINQAIKLCYANNIQYIGYGNGDSGIAMHIKAIRLARNELKDTATNRRTTITHSQFVRNDQLDEYKELGIIPCFFTDHTFMFGDVHITNLGRERAFFLSPMNTAKQKGLIFNNHTDYPSAPPAGLFTVWTAVNRTSRTNVVIGPDERVSCYDALKAITSNAAWMYFEENIKGSIKKDKLADLVILDKNPLKADPMSIKEIKVMETIKEGKTVYKK